MHDTIVKMKSGTIHCGPIATYRPKEGWMELFTLGERLYFRDMVSAITCGVMDRINVIQDRDEIRRARDEGWDGKT